MRGSRLTPALVVASILPVAFSSLRAGDEAPPIEPSAWLNTGAPLSWEDLEGRAVLVEKWATW